MNLLEYARKPYPLNLNRWGTILIISLFISFFLVIFQPFGLQNLESRWKNLLIAGYGLVTCIVLILDTFLVPLIFPALFKEEKWTISKEILLLACIVISHNRLLKQNLEASYHMNRMIGEKKNERARTNNDLIITSESKNQTLEIPASNLICIESEGNYVNTWYLEEGRIVRLLIRNTIKNIETQIQEAGNLFKCHRAYIINLSHIEKVMGNSQGYRLLVKYLDKEIPVARNYSKSFREALSKSP